MRTFRIHLLLLPALMLLGAQPAQSLTLDQAVGLALENNPRVRQFDADREEAGAQVGFARAPYYPWLAADYEYSKRDQDPFNQGTELSTLTLSATYNLWNGLADHNRLQAAKARHQGADYQLQSVRQDVALEAKQAYIAELRARSARATADEGVELLQRQWRDASLQLAQGLIARNELLRIEVERSSARQDRLRAERDLRVARQSLERVLALRLPASETLVDFDALPLLESKTEEELGPELAQRNELRYLRQLHQASLFDRDVVDSVYTPSLDLELAHEQLGDSLLPQGRDNNYNSDTRFMIRANWRLFSGFAAREEMKIQDARSRSIRARMLDLQGELGLQLQRALEDLQLSRGLQKEALVAVEQAQENYRVTENRHRQQQATSVELLDAQFLLTRARNQELSARYDLHRSVAVLDRVLEREIPK